MPRLVFVTQLIDPADPVLGFVVPQVRALAKAADLVVIANEVRDGAPDLGVETISLGKERGLGSVARGRRYVTAIASEVRRRRPDALVAHMCPIYLTAAAPIALVARVPRFLWFVHPEDSRSLRVAERLSTGVLTALPGSYPRRGPTIHEIGHAIDTDGLRPSAVHRPAGAPLRLVALGRTSRVKGYDQMVRAVAAARASGIDVTLRIVGPSVTPDEIRCREDLKTLVGSVARGSVSVDDGVARDAVARTIGAADVLVNATEPGSADKVVFEAMAVGRPVLAASPAFAPLLAGTSVDLAFARGDVASLTERVRVLAAMPAAQLDALGLSLRRRVEAEHSLDHWAASVVRVVSEASARAMGSAPAG